MRVYVESYGCSQNLGEGHAIGRDLQRAGHQLAQRAEDAEAGILVTCAVIGSTERRMVRRWQQLSALLPHVYVTGCLIPLRSELLTGPGAERTTVVPIREQHRIPELLGEPEARSITSVVEPNGPSETLVAEEVVIAQGCTSHCSYCYSRLARGPLQSVALPTVLARVRDALNRGAREIRLSSLDTSCWGSEFGEGRRLPELLEAVDGLAGDFDVRIGMMSPQSLRPILTGFTDSLGSSRHAYHFLHLPVQSGDDGVLDDMRRGYTTSEFLDAVAAVRAAVPDVTLATDIIVGFPGESEQAFASTLSLIERASPEIVNVTRFSPRPMTPAAKHDADAVSAPVAKARSRRIAELRRQVARRKMERWIGWSGRARVVERGSGSTSVARLRNYLPVVLPGSLPLGEPIEVRIDGARSTYLLGEPVDYPS